MIIDTNVYSALDRGEPSAVASLQGVTSIDIPVCVIGELCYGFMNGTRTQLNTQRLDRFIAREQTHVLYPTVETARLFGYVSMFCRKAGRALSQNDLWIAALAQEHDLRLATYDQDFEIFADMLGDKLVILGR